jgi:hypothetical protein
MVVWPFIPKGTLLNHLPASIVEALNTTYYSVENSCVLKVFVLAFIAYADYCLWRNWACDKQITYQRSLMALLALEILCIENGATFASLGFADVRVILSISLLILLACRFCRVIPSFHKETPRLQGGFATNTFQESEYTESKTRFINSQIDKLLNTSLTNAFSVGISGDWGSGKTTFLDLIKKELKGRAYVIEFNPWSYNDSEQVLTDFFNALRKGLKDNHYMVDRPIAEYASMVTETGTSGLLSILIKILRLFHHYTLQDKKEQLSAILKKVDKPIWIFVDDMDRLESEEIFEVLRLIRNVGDLSNMVYITAYDKDFVVKMLQKRGIEKPDNYIEKIFDVEFCLPRIEPYELQKLLLDDLKQSGVSEEIITKVVASDIGLILNILCNYRQVKRFTRLYSLNLHYMQTEMKGDFNPFDLFWLSLLQMYDMVTYNNLFYKTDLYLDLNETKYLMWKGIGPKDDCFEYSNTEHTFNDLKLSEYTPRLLARLFASKQEETYPSSIRYAIYFRKYFSHIQSSKKLTNPMFKALVGRPIKASVDSMVKYWIEEKYDLNSILFQFQYEDKAKLDLKESENVLWGLISLVLYNDELGTEEKSTIRKLISKENYNQEQKDDLSTFIEQEIEFLVFQPNNPIRINELLQYFYSTEMYFNGRRLSKINRSFLTNEQVTSFVTTNMERYLDNHPNIKLEELFDKQSEFSRMVKSATFLVKDDEANSYRLYKNLAEGQLDARLRSLKSNYTHEKLKEIYNQMYTPEPLSVSGKEIALDKSTAKEQVDLMYAQHFSSERRWVENLIDSSTVYAEENEN